MQMTKEVAKKLREGHYVENGIEITHKEFKKLKFRKTNSTEIERCATIIGDDSQSGPLYCGDIAEYVGKRKKGILWLCERHYDLISSR